MSDPVDTDWVLDDHVEIRVSNGELDEVVTHDAGMFHLEKMSDQTVWMAIYHPDDGNNSRVIVTISAVKGPDGEPRIEATVEVE